MNDEPGADNERSLAVELDGVPHRVRHGTALADLVASLGHSPSAVATAVNGRFVPRSLRAERLLEPGDAVSLFQPIVGG